ncbi:MAG TPA: universal stress protein [Conexibacter sp.]|nr:universal stress protein [Conexibacter sp.]
MTDSAPTRVLLVANRTAATDGLLEAVRARAQRGQAAFHLVVPAHPHGLHKVVDPQEGDAGEAERVLAKALPLLSAAAGTEVTGHVGDHEPLMAIEDAIHRAPYDEIVISTLPRRLSRWLHLDLVSKARGTGLPVTHVEASEREHAPERAATV